MAYATLVSLERTLDQILNHDRFSITPHERKQIIFMDKCVISFQAFLEDFPEKAKNLEAIIRDVAAEAEDIIEWFMSDQIQFGFTYTDWLTILRRIKFRFQLHTVSHEMELIALVVVEKKSSITVRNAQLGGTASASQVADSDTGKTVMVDPNEDLIKIKDLLCGDEPQLQVLPICGMGGIGKTTLARNAYCDPLIMEQFDIRAWVTVSQDYSTQRILLELLDAMKEFDPEQRNECATAWDREVVETSQHSNEPPEKSNERDMEVEFATAGSQQMDSEVVQTSKHSNEPPPKVSKKSKESDMELKLHKILTGRRFLIVMDDMWSTRVFDYVKKLFPNDNNGSRIMITTRLREVASYANSPIPSHEMRLMNADQSWTLLQQKVHIPPELKSIGREIARSCRGLPLAITVIAGILSTVSKTLFSWENIAEKVKKSIASADGHIEKILSLSYPHLPHHLRPCFLYMGGFPEDHEIKVTQLTRLWIAEGFVKPIVSKSFEDTAQEYLEDLINRSLILIKKRNSNGKIKSCSLHDMIRDMCISLCQEEKFLVHLGGVLSVKKLWLQEIIKDQRRISISNTYQSYYNSFDNIFCSTVRSILYFSDRLGSFGSFRLLRVLDILRVKYVYCYPPQLFELFHLRYLAMHDLAYPIPRAISNLQCLQTLILGGLPRFDSSSIWNMPQLRHLIFHASIPDPNGATFPLENLQTLGEVCDFDCSITILNMIPNLKKLRLYYFPSYRGRLFLSNLVHLRLLEKLHLKFNPYLLHPSHDLNNLYLPSSLKKLTLIFTSREDKYLNIVGPFPNLEVLKLKGFNFKQQEWSTTDEDFPQLKYLLIDESNLKQWSVERSHFPKLKTLMIHACLDLCEIPDEIGEIPTLELIELKNCRKSLADCVQQIQEDAQDYGNDGIQVFCIDCNHPIEKPPSPPQSPKPTPKPKPDPKPKPKPKAKRSSIPKSRLRRYNLLR